MTGLARTTVLPEAVPEGELSAHFDVQGRGLLGPLYVDSSRLLRANTGHSSAARRTAQVDPKRPSIALSHLASKGTLTALNRFANALESLNQAPARR
jgi:hypothetical protein